MTSASRAIGVPARRRETFVRVAAGTFFLGILLAAGGRWTTDLGCAIPDAAAIGNVGWGADARLILYVLGWVSHALRDGAAHVFDPPVGFPAPGVLTGSEHFFGAQLVFTPAVLATGNVVWAANVTTLASYWLAGFVPFVLLRRHGFGIAPAVAAGVVNAFGPLQVPADVHQLQFPAWGVPLVLLAADHVAADASRRARLAFAATLVLTILVSYQLAANALVTAVVIVGVAALRGRERRGQVRAYLTGLAISVAVLLLVSWPYMLRLREPGQAAIARTQYGPDSGALMAQIVAASVDPWWLVLAVAGAGTALVVPRLRCIALGGAVLAVIGAVLACGWSTAVGGVVVPLPYALLAMVPGSASVQPTRFLLLTATGLALLAGCALDAIREGLGSRRLGAVIATVATAAVTAHGLVSFTPPATTCLAIGDSAPQVYRWLAERPGGAVLDLRGDYPRRLGPLVDAASAMLGSLVHGHPLLGVHSHHIPPASALVMRVMQRPPSPQALQALVDMTHVRWIVLPPPAPGKIDSGWPRVPGVVPVAEFADGRVFEVRREPRFAWLSALSASPRDDRTLLGTSLAPVTDPRGEVSVASPVRSSAPASHVVVSVHVVNRGATAWPVAGLAEAPVVHVEARWLQASDAAQPIALPWDLEPGEAVDVIAYLASPAAPGRYMLDAVVKQGDAVFPAQSRGPEIEVR